MEKVKQEVKRIWNLAINNKSNRYEPVPLLTKEDAQTAYSAQVTKMYKDKKIPPDYMKNFDQH